MEECIFCKIIKGEIPSYKVYEDKDYIGILDINPLNLGHTLVIPKKHSRWVWDIEDFGVFFEEILKVEKALEKALDTDWVVLATVGVHIAHAHAHLIPRYKGDGHGGFINPKATKKVSEEKMKEIASKIKKAVSQERKVK